MPNDYDTNNITLDNLRHATLILECDDKFVLMPMRGIRQVTRSVDYAEFTSNYNIECAGCGENIKVLQKGIDMPWDVHTDFESSEELEDFLSQFQRSELNA